MTKSTARAEWTGVLKSGKGDMYLGEVSFPYSFNSRMEAGGGSTPEQLLASALSGCFSMALSAELEKAGFPAKHVSTTGTANFDNSTGKWSVESIDLKVEASVPSIDDAKFQEIATGAKSGCPVSRALSAVTINLSAKLV